MLFLVICNYGPEVRDEITLRRAQKGIMMPEGIKVVGEWSPLTGGQVYLVLEGDDPALFLAAARAWSDLMTIESIPIIETEKMMELLKARM